MSITLNASTSSGFVQSADNSGEIELQSNGTTALKVNTNEGIQILNCLGVGNATPSTSGAGITFPATQSASSDANTLDDYEEGTWTPVLSRDGTAPSISYGIREGKYTKIGNMVTCWITINSITVSSAGTGNNILTGLPFAIGNSTYGGTGGFGYNDAFTNTVYGVVMTGGTTQVYFRGGARSSGNDNGGWSSGGYLGLTITYFI